MTVNVLKSNGSLEPLNLNKILQWSEWAAKDCPDVSLESLLSTIPFSNGISTKDITIAICQKCEELSIIEANKGDVNLSEQYFKVARNLYIPNLIKRCNITYQKYLTDSDIHSYGYKLSQDNIVPLNRYKIKSILNFGVSLGIYNKDLIDGTLPDELFDYADSLLDYSDMNTYFYCGLRQTEEKYLIKYNTTELYEDPLIQKMLMALQCARSDANVFPEGKTLEFLKETVLNQYLLAAKTKANDPSPFSTYLRTNHKQYDSCCLVELEDTADSINTAAFTVYNATTQGAGIGLSMGAIRASGTLFKNRGKHGGNFGYAKYASTSIKATSQVDRGGSANTFFPIWHRDVLSTMMYKDATGGAEGENRLRHLDYSFIFNGYLLEKYENNGKILLTTPNTLLKSGKTLYDSFFNVDENGFYDDSEFVQYCEEQLQNPDLPQITPTNVESIKPGIDCFIYAKDLWTVFVNQQSSTNRLYNLAIDHTNNHSPFLQPIKMSNLCMEILQPTTPVSLSYDSKTNTYVPNDGEVSFCQLGAIVFGSDNTKYEEIENICYWILRRQESIFNISDYSKIPFSHKQKTRRNVGIGIANGQRLLVEEVFTKFPVEEWITESAKITHKYAEAFQYYLIKASVRLAKELGPCEDFNLTKYSKGILPIDTCTLTELNDFPLLKDWKGLRKDVLKYGMRNSCLTACMPVESSSVEKQLLPYFEFPRKLVTYKGNKKLTVAVPVPALSKFGHKYITAWDDTKINKNYLYLACSSNVNKFIDQSISYNSYFNLNDYPNRKIPIDIYMRDVYINPYKQGMRTHYYVNINTEEVEETNENIVEVLKQQAQQEAEAESCAGGTCKL